MKTPDLTPAQLVSGLVALAGALIVLFKLNLTQEQQAALGTIIATVVPTAWIVADAIIRHGRNANAAAQAHLAAVQIAATPADVGDAS